MFETMIPYVMGDHLYGHTFEPPKAGFGYPRIMSPQRRPYRTKDGYVCCLIYTDRQWELFLRAIGRAELLATDPRLRDITARTNAIDELYQLVAEEMAKRTTAEWQALLPESEIPLFPMHTLDSLLDDEHLQATQFFRRVEHPVVGTIVEPSVPSRWSGTPPEGYRPAPMLGEHTAEVLAEAGFSEAQIAELMARGVVRGAARATQAPAPDTAS
jgi:crotonobetainyl-CoA:carnitine CoA-transferase CaiB-like acyl-CoA transferase